MTKLLCYYFSICNNPALPNSAICHECREVVFNEARHMVLPDGEPSADVKN